MKILVLKNSLSIDIEQSCTKAVEYYATRLSFPISFEFKEINLPVKIKAYSQFNGFDTQTGKPALISLYGLEDSVKEATALLITPNTYHAVIFAWDTTSIPAPKNGMLTSWTNYGQVIPGTEFIQLATNPQLQSGTPTDHIYNAITHELIHTFCKKLARKGVTILDEMDSTLVEGKRISYYHNDEPSFPDGNYARTLANLKPYFSLLDSVAQTGYKYFKESEVKGLKPELVEMLDRARGYAGVPFKITSGFRTVADNARVGGVADSEHTTGEAVDIAVPDSVTGGKILKGLAQALLYAELPFRFGFYRDNHVHVDISKDKPSPCYWIK